MRENLNAFRLKNVYSVSSRLILSLNEISWTRTRYLYEVMIIYKVCRCYATSHDLRSQLNLRSSFFLSFFFCTPAENYATLSMFLWFFQSGDCPYFLRNVCCPGLSLSTWHYTIFHKPQGSLGFDEELDCVRRVGERSTTTECIQIFMNDLPYHF